MRGWSTGHSPAKGNCPSLSVGVTERLWHWVLIWGLEHSRTLGCDDMATAMAPFDNMRCTSHLIYVGIVVVGHHVNLWCNHATVWYARRHYRYVGRYSQQPNHTRVRCSSWSYDLIYDIVQLWSDSYPEGKALIPQLHEHDNLWDSWQSLPCAFIWKSGFCQREHTDRSWM